MENEEIESFSEGFHNPNMGFALVYIVYKLVFKWTVYERIRIDEKKI